MMSGAEKMRRASSQQRATYCASQCVEGDWDFGLTAPTAKKAEKMDIKITIPIHSPSHAHAYHDRFFMFDSPLALLVSGNAHFTTVRSVQRKKYEVGETGNGRGEG